jgi:hypothetical protein
MACIENVFSAMKKTIRTPAQRKPKSDPDRLKTPYPNLIRYKSIGNYFGRVRVNGKLIRHPLKTRVRSVAKLKLSDFLQDHRRLAINKGEPVKGEVTIALFKKEIEDDPLLEQLFSLGQHWLFDVLQLFAAAASPASNSSCCSNETKA